MYEKDDIGLVDATMSGLKMLDLFSGIGGFHEGFKRAGYEFDWVGYSEIDKYASAVYGYNYKKSEELGDIKLIQPRRDLPDNIDILCGGFPCQAFSVAGKRLGFDDTRGTLFFEIARLLTHYVENKRPVRCLVLENVKGLLSHDDGRTFAVIYRILSDLGYTIEFQLLNTRWWLPQNRERIYIVGYIGNRGGPQVFPIGESSTILGESRGSGKVSKISTTITADYRKGVHACGETYVVKGLKQIGTIGKDSEATRVYDANGISRTIKDGCGMGAKTGLYQVDTLKRNQDSYDFNSRVYSIEGIAKTLAGDGGNNDNKTGLYKVRGGLQKNASEIENCSTALTEAMGKGGGHTPLLIKEATKKGYAEAEVGDSINLSVPNSETRRGRVGKGEAQTLDTGMQQYTIQSGVRRLTPVECNRLQGFSDDHNKYGVMDGKVVEMSDTQRYKQAGNAVTVDVVQAVATIIKEKELV